MIPVIIAADYPIYEQRVGGMDRFFWSLDTALKTAEVSPVWVFPESTSYDHYREQGLDIRFVHRSSFAGNLTVLIAGEGGVEVLVTHFMSYNTRYPAAWRRAGARRIISVDHMSRPMVPRPFGYRARNLLKGLITSRKVDSVIAVSGFVRQSIMRELGWWWGHKTRVVWNGVVPASLDSDEGMVLHPDEFRMCFVGYLMREKGLHVALEAAAGIVDDGASIRITIAGDGPEAEPLAELASKLGLKDCVDFIGPTKSQMELMREHDMVLIPSLWKEACPLVVLEAMMAGACILASDIGGIPELLGTDGGLTVKPGDVDAWRAAMKTLLQDAERRSLYRLSARRRAAEHFTLARMVQDHAREIESTYTT